MKKNKENFKEMDKSELQKRLILLREEIRVVKFKAEGSKSKNVKENKFRKKQIAQILTELNKN
jgi:ribosomal protein L29